MRTRAGRELLNSGKGANGTEEPWSLDGVDLSPADPSDSRIAISSAWAESGNDLRPLSSPVSDTYFTYSGSDLTPNPI